MENRILVVLQGLRDDGSREFCFNANLAKAICRITAPEDISDEDLLKKASTIRAYSRATTNYDDDYYQMGQSPFNGRWYVFASFAGVSEVASPDYIFDEFPEKFEDTDTDNWWG